MPLPIELIPGDVARANDVNANFAYIMSIIGQLSTPDRVTTTTEFLMGARQNVLFTGTHDVSGHPERNFFQIGYNADFNYSVSQDVWKFQRFINKTSSPTENTAASALRLGPGEIAFWGTSSQEANLNASMRPVFKIKLTQDNPSTDYIYVPRSIAFQGVDREAEELDDYRLTYVPLASPGIIYDGIPLNKAATAKLATDYGVSRYAKAIQITCHVQADSASDAQIKFYQMRSNPSARYGFVISAIAGKRGSGQGLVHLGIDGYAGQFYIERDANFDSVSAYVMGYWL